MPRKLQRKLVDIAATSFKLQEILERWLHNQHIPFERQTWEGPDAGFLRYFVSAQDINVARAILPALQDIARGRRDAS